MLSTRVGTCLWVSRKLRRYPPRVPSNVTAQACTAVKESEHSTNEGWFFLDSIFPIRLGTWDLRHYFALFRREALLGKLGDIFQDVDVHGFEVQSIEPRLKDGGVFVNFRYKLASLSDPECSQGPTSGSTTVNPALADIEQAVLKTIEAKGGLPSWLGLKHGNLWRVRGKPWREDMRRYASPILRVSFDGPDVPDEKIWELMRPFGRIRDVIPPSPVSPGTLRSATVTYERTAASTIAHNCIYGTYVSPSTSERGILTRLTTAYERPMNAHLIRDWLASHPKIVLPVLVFIVGTLTYTVFDPIRAIAVQAKVMGWLDYREFALTKWLRQNALDRLATVYSPSGGKFHTSADTSMLKDRREAESTIDSYLSDIPSTIIFIHGPTGSGKGRLLRSVLEKSNRRTMVIDCADVFSRGSDAAMIRSLAEETGYRPIFSFLNSVNNLIDLASVALIGQKAGLSSSLEEQVTQVLGVVSDGLRRVGASCRKETEHRIAHALKEEQAALGDAERRERIRRGVWHDGRIDCVAGNGVMSELGVGIESFGPNDEDGGFREWDEEAKISARPELVAKTRRELEYSGTQDIASLPVVVIKNFGANMKAGKVEVLAKLAEWAADLVSNHVAHVIVLSDNRENAKRLAEALPTKPLSTVALADADPASSLSYIIQKLKEAGVDYNISSEETRLIERFGGRASDLELMIHKVRTGQTVPEAVEDIIQRGVAEVRKNAFGDDLEDAKRLSWTRQQAWTVLKLLAQNDELQYYQVLLDFPVKGDESALRAMERAELISITTADYRPSTIRPGRPILRYVFGRLVSDRVFQAVQDIGCNELLIAGAESVINSVESELAVLKEIISGPESYGSAVTRAKKRAKYLTGKMEDAVEKVVKLESENIALRKVLCESGIEKEEQNRRKRWVW